MSRRDDTQNAAPGPSAYRLERFDVVVKGRWHELGRSVLLLVALLALQQPLRSEALESPGTTPYVEPVVSLRISLVLDVVFIITYVLVAYRAWGLVRVFRAPPLATRTARFIAYYGIAALAIVDCLEDIHLWRAYADGDAVTSLSWGPSHAILLIGLPVALVISVGVVLLSDPRLYWRRTGVEVIPRQSFISRPSWLVSDPARNRWKGALASSPDDGSCCADDTTAPSPPESQRDWGIVCCSGGGIRSAAFSLGGLQSLNAHDLYEKADAVIGVSGGGYTSTAFHVLRWQSDDAAAANDDHDHVWGVPADEAFTQRSPELQWLRRHTHYVLDSVRVAVQGGFALAFGIAVNLVLLAIAIGALAWFLGWLFLASGTITLPVSPIDDLSDVRSTMQVDPGGDWWWLEHVWWVPLAGIGLFLAERAWDKFQTVPHHWRMRLRAVSTALLAGGAAGIVLLLALPALIGALYNYADSSGTAYARLIYQLGIVPREHCQDVLAAPGATAACGVTATPDSGTGIAAASVVTIVASILAVLASLRSAGTTSQATSGVGGVLKRVWAKIKDPVVPWLAVSLIIVVCLLQLVRWTAEFTTRPDRLDNWSYVQTAAILLVLLKVFTDPNRTSLHHFFRERIAFAFLVRRRHGKIESLPYREPVRFSRSRPPAGGGPRLVTCAVANASDATLIPSQRGCTPFVFDDEAIGLTDRMLPADAARRGSATYEFYADHGYRDATIPAAVAMSAAAFSPLAGRENVRLGPYRAVLALGNARLGVWLPNPLWTDMVRLAGLQARLRDADFAKTWQRLTCQEAQEVWDSLGSARPWARLVCEEDPAAEPRHRGLWADTVAARSKPPWHARPIEVGRTIVKKPGITRVVREAVGKASIYDRFLYVTDGGHYDNLGLIEALRRRPRRIFVLDASNDAEDTFRALGLAVATARMDLDCELRIDPRPMRRLEDKRSAAAWCTGTATFADGTECAIYLVKAIMIDNEAWDVETYAASNLDFPRTSTGRQLYSEFDFEAYRMLGVQAVDRLVGSLEYLEREADITPDEALCARTGREAALAVVVEALMRVETAATGAPSEQLRELELLERALGTWKAAVRRADVAWAAAARAGRAFTSAQAEHKERSARTESANSVGSG